MVAPLAAPGAYPLGAAMFAIDVELLPAGQPAVVDARALGYPFPLAQLPPGEYSVQAVLNVYERSQRSDGRTIWVPLNDGRQEFFTASPGNLYSDPQRVRVTTAEPSGSPSRRSSRRGPSLKAPTG